MSKKGRRAFGSRRADYENREGYPLEQPNFEDAFRPAGEPEEITPEEEPEARNGHGRREFPEDVAKRKKRQRLIIGLVVAVAALAVMGVAAKTYINSVVHAPDVPTPVARTDIDIQQQREEVDENGHTDVSLDLDETVTRGEGVYTFLVAGLDKGEGNSDTLMVAKYDVTNQVVNVMSIPRDTCINVNWGVNKINAAYSHGGVEQIKKEVKKILGFSVDYYMVVDLTAFEKVVDAIGGVDFDVPVNMHYHDPTQSLSIDIAAGYQHLNGENALKVARFRSGYSDADIGRIRTQQALLTAIAKQTLKLENLAKVDEFVQIFKEYVDTDLTIGELTWLATQLMNVDTENDLHFMTLPANTNDAIRGLSYVTIYVNQLVDMINEYFNPYDTPITASNLNIITRSASGALYATNGGALPGFDDYTYLHEGENGDGEDPGTEAPGTEDPGTEDPGVEDPGTGDPGTEDPGTEDPGTGDPGTEDPGTGDPGTEDPGTGGEDPGPGTEDPGTGGDDGGGEIIIIGGDDEG